MNWLVCILAVIELALVMGAHGLRPVVCLHGLNRTADDCQPLGAMISAEHVGQPFYALDVGEADMSAFSFGSMFAQIKMVQNNIHEIINQRKHEFADGFHIVGYSQGALVARAIIEMDDDLVVHNFLSIASPQAGQFGRVELFIQSVTAEQATEVLYSSALHNVSSIAQFWRHPQYSQYLQYNAFLPYINNELRPQLRFKTNFLRLSSLHMFASDADEIISPWQSGVFGFYGEDGHTIEPMEKQVFFLNDTFGLKTLSDTGRLFTYTPTGKSHTSWYTKETIKEFLLPHLLEDEAGK